jgi:methylated-DNA-protein-cysteine methyltransferase related protein
LWVAAFYGERSESIAAKITFATFGALAPESSLCVVRGPPVWKLASIAVIFTGMDAAWKRLYALVKRIPKGRVTTYGELARAVRLPGGARAAGRAMASCPRGQAIPWHRVVAAGGRIVIREPFAGLQRRLLESEGARIIERRVAAEHAWAPPRSAPKRQRAGPGKSKLRRVKRSGGRKRRS